jgi:hypothetical protein
VAEMAKWWVVPEFGWLFQDEYGKVRLGDKFVGEQHYYYIILKISRCLSFVGSESQLN